MYIHNWKPVFLMDTLFWSKHASVFCNKDLTSSQAQSCVNEQDTVIQWN